MVWGGRKRNYDMNEDCFQLKNGSWQRYSPIKITGLILSYKTVMIRNTIYTFGADENKREVRYLPANSKDWIVCKTEIPSF